MTSLIQSDTNGTTIIRVKRKRAAEPLNSLFVSAALRESPRTKEIELGGEDSEPRTHVFRLMDTVSLKATDTQTSRIQRKIRRVLKKHSEIGDTLEDRRNKRLHQQREKKGAEINRRRQWNGVVNEWADFSISDTLDDKPQPPKPVFHKRMRKATEEHLQDFNVSNIEFVDVEINGGVTSLSTVRTLSNTSNSASLASSPSKSPTKVLNPQQRRMDEAIFTAFTTLDTSKISQLLGHFKDVNFTREVDGTTPLMASAWCGHMDLCLRLVSLGADPSAVDVNGASATELASRRGHVEVSQRLSELVAEQEEAQYVFDIYCLDVKNTTKPMGVSIEGKDQSSCVTLVEPLRLSRHELLALRRGTTMGAVDDEDSDDHLVLDDTDSSDYGEDEDSNDEGDFRNDYPDEEGDESWMPGHHFDDDHGLPTSRSFSSDEDTHRMHLPDGIDFSDVWTPREVSLPQMQDYSADYDSD